MDSGNLNSGDHEVTYASFWMRVLAHNIDLLLIILPLFIVRIYLEDQTTLYILTIVYYMLFHIGFEMSGWCGSPGKRLVQIKSLNTSLKKPGLHTVIIRNLLKIPSALLLFLGFLMINFTGKKQALHDLIAGTVVINSR